MLRCLKNSICGALLLPMLFSLVGCQKEDTTVYVTEYEKRHYNQAMYWGSFFAENLCVTDSDIALEGYPTDPQLHAVGMFDVTDQKVLYAQNLFGQLYPASTTKILTAYVALKYGNPDDIITVSENAVKLDKDAILSGIKPGDQLTLRDLLNGLLLASGNDCALSIAEYISGSEETFVALMNEEAKKIGATGTHFCNPHGLHSPDHYTTAYDLYLIFQACIQNEEFLNIISQASYTANITNPATGARTINWRPTNYYSLGKINAPEGVRVLGGKTGTTDEAGCCVILYEEGADGKGYITVVMGAGNRDILYANTNALMQSGIVNQ